MPAAKKADGPKKTSSSHASYQDMITDAIVNLKERNGSSRQNLKKYVKANNNLNVASDKQFDSLFNKALKNGVEKGVFEQPKGPSGSTKLAKQKPEAKKAAAPKKTAAVKKATTTAKKPATTTAKRTAATPAPKKPAATTAKRTAATPAPKRTAPPKKDPTPKAEKPDVVSKTKSGRVAKTPKAPAKKAAPKKAATKKATATKA